MAYPIDVILQWLLSFIRATLTEFTNFTRKNVQDSAAVVNLVSLSKHYSCRFRRSVRFGLIRARVPNRMIFFSCLGIKNVNGIRDSRSIRERVLVNNISVRACPCCRTGGRHARSTHLRVPSCLPIAYCVQPDSGAFERTHECPIRALRDRRDHGRNAP